MKITLASIIVNDPIEAFKFYTGLLGFVERMYIPEAKLAIVVSPEDINGTGLLLEPNDNPVGQTFQEALYKQGLPAIVLGTDDIQREYERLKKLGVVFTKEPTKTEWGTQAILDDTCGNLIQLH
jgi:predicted enzyme related to lactoylglutathione lyase